MEGGEKPDGQYFAPEDYATLYIQWATALHRVDPKLKLGGPVFEGVNEDIPAWRDKSGDTSWFRRFLAYLKARASSESSRSCRSSITRSTSASGAGTTS